MTIIFSVGLFFSIIGANLKIDVSCGVKSSELGLVKNYNLSTTNNLFDITLIEIAAQKQLGDYSIFGTKIKDIYFLDINLYDFFMESFPDYTNLKNINEKANLVYDFLQSKEFYEISGEIYGDSLKDGSELVNNIATTGKEYSTANAQTIKKLSIIHSRIGSAIFSAEKTIKYY